MLKFQDRLHAQEYFHKAASGAIRSFASVFCFHQFVPLSRIVGDAAGTICRCYMKLHDYPTIFLQKRMMRYQNCHMLRGRS
jgi:hypothetical protein